MVAPRSAHGKWKGATGDEAEDEFDLPLPIVRRDAERTAPIAVDGSARDGVGPLG